MKEEIEKEIKTAAGRLASHLHNVEINGVSDYIQYDFKCKDLLDWNDIDIRQSEEHKELFNKLADFTGPVLYFFEITSNQDTGLLRQCLIKYKTAEGSKSVPAIKKGYCKNSKILYVGKVKKKD